MRIIEKPVSSEYMKADDVTASASFDFPESPVVFNL